MSLHVKIACHWFLFNKYMNGSDEKSYWYILDSKNRKLQNYNLINER